MTPRVALIGANGHGRWHRRSIAELQAAGALRLVAVAEPNPLDPDPPLPPDVAVFTGHRELLAAIRPDVVVIASPPHTHLPITLDVLAAGSDVLLEKPPVRTLAEHHELTEAVRASRAASARSGSRPSARPRPRPSSGRSPTGSWAPSRRSPRSRRGGATTRITPARRGPGGVPSTAGRWWTAPWPTRWPTR